MSDIIDFDSVDYFRDPRTVLDPFPMFDHFRSKCPVVQEGHHDVFMVTGYDEVIEVFNDTDRFSSCIATTGPFSGVNMPLDGLDDVSDVIEQYRPQLPFNDQLPTFDPPVHTAQRGLLMRLITPKRLAENEAAMHDIASRQIDEFIDRGECEYVSEYAQPFALLVVADLLGVPDADRDHFRDTMLRRNDVVGAGAMTAAEAAHAPLAWLYEQFSEYIEDRRREPRGDVLTGLAQATFPDGSLPEVIDAVRIAANLYAAGQETTVRLLSTALKLIGERPELQARLRAEPGLVPNFIVVCLRLL
jgi:cytochrome P450